MRKHYRLFLHASPCPFCDPYETCSSCPIATPVEAVFNYHLPVMDDVPQRFLTDHGEEESVGSNNLDDQEDLDSWKICPSGDELICLEDFIVPEHVEKETEGAKVEKMEKHEESDSCTNIHFDSWLETLLSEDELICMEDFVIPDHVIKETAGGSKEENIEVKDQAGERSTE